MYWTSPAAAAGHYLKNLLDYVFSQIINLLIVLMFLPYHLSIFNNISISYFQFISS